MGYDFWEQSIGCRGHADALQNNFGGLGNGRDASLNSFLDGDTKVDGRPVSKTNPLPVVNAENHRGSLLDYLVDPNSTAGKIVNAAGGAIRSLVGGDGGSNGSDVGPSERLAHPLAFAACGPRAASSTRMND